MLKVAVSVFLLGAAPAAAPPDIGLFVDAASLEEGPAREAQYLGPRLWLVAQAASSCSAPAVARVRAAPRLPTRHGAAQTIANASLNPR